MKFILNMKADFNMSWFVGFATLSGSNSCILKSSRFNLSVHPLYIPLVVLNTKKVVPFFSFLLAHLSQRLIGEFIV